MSAVANAPEPVVETAAGQKKCRMDEVLGAGFIELLGLAPANPLVRGLLLARTGRMPDPDCRTFEQLREWIEMHCDRKSCPARRPGSGDGDGIAVRVAFSDTEYGRANYSVGRGANEELRLTEDELVQLAESTINDGAGLEQLVDSLAQIIDEEAWDRCDPVLEDDGDYNYDSHESDDTGNNRIEFSRGQLLEELVRFLRDRHPQLLEAL
jgi:hypothetical protein